MLQGAEGRRGGGQRERRAGQAEAGGSGRRRVAAGIRSGTYGLLQKERQHAHQRRPEHAHRSQHRPCSQKQVELIGVNVLEDSPYFLHGLWCNLTDKDWGAQSLRAALPASDGGGQLCCTNQTNLSKAEMKNRGDWGQCVGGQSSFDAWTVVHHHGSLIKADMEAIIAHADGRECGAAPGLTRGGSVVGAGANLFEDIRYLHGQPRTHRTPPLLGGGGNAQRRKHSQPDDHPDVQRREHPPKVCLAGHPRAEPDTNLFEGTCMKEGVRATKEMPCR